jgi:phenylacetate 2-hydroxylase
LTGFTIGSSPYDESCKKRRKAAATALAKPAMRKYLPMFDLETFCVIRDYRKKAMSSDAKDFEFNPRPFLQRFALNTTLTLCYGIRMDDAYDELLREILCIISVDDLIIDVGSAISLLRSASENYQDYIPVLFSFII